MAPRCIEAVWMGQISRTGEHIMIRANGDAVRFTIIKSTPEQHRWRHHRIKQICGTPRRPAPSMQNAKRIESRWVDEEASAPRIPHKVAVNMEDDQPEQPDTGAAIKTFSKGREAGVLSWELRITDQVLERHGFTDDCIGCDVKRSGMPAEFHRNHTAACRQRIYHEMAKGERGIEALEAVRKILAERRKIVYGPK